MIPCTAPGVRAIIPTNTEIQPKQSANAIEQRRAPPSTPSQPVATRKPMSMPKPIVHDEQDQVADDVGDDGADQRRGPGDRQRPEPVEDALLDVGVEVLTPMRDAGHRDGLAEQARQQELQVVLLRAAGDRAAEDVGEQHQEDDRLQRDVDQRLGGAPDLDQAAPGQRQGVPPVSRRLPSGSTRRSARAARRSGRWSLVR